jgi:hypothetical protein
MSAALLKAKMIRRVLVVGLTCLLMTQPVFWASFRRDVRTR